MPIRAPKADVTLDVRVTFCRGFVVVCGCAHTEDNVTVLIILVVLVFVLISPTVMVVVGRIVVVVVVKQWLHAVVVNAGVVDIQGPMVVGQTLSVV